MTRAVRRCRRDALNSAVAVGLVAIGTASTAAVFSLLYPLALAPLPFPDSSRLVVLMDRDQSGGLVGITPGRYRDWTARLAPSLVLGAMRPGQSFNVLDDSGPFRATGVLADRAFFSVLNRRPEAGRFFDERDLAPDGSPVVIASHALWRQRLRADPAVVGRLLNVDGIAHEIVGVLPADWPTPAGDADLWLPLRLTVWNRVSRILTLVGRLQPSATIERARMDLAASHALMASNFADTDGVVMPDLQELRTSLAGAARVPIVFVFAASVGLVGLIGLNLAMLSVARVAARRREIAVQRALGATSADVARLLLAEGSLLVGTGAAIGIVLTQLASPLIETLVSGAYSSASVRAAPILSLPVFGVAVATAFVIMLLASMAPIAMAARVPPFELLRVRSGESGSRSRRVLIIVETAGAVTLLLTAVALTRSVLTLSRVDPGFDARGVLTARVTLPATSHGAGQVRRAIGEQLAASLAALPGIEGAAVSSALPFRTATSPFSFLTDTPGSSGHQAEHRSVSTGYIETVGLRVLAGRTFTAADRQDSPLAAIVSERLVRLWPGATPATLVGRRLSIDGPSGPWREIVGVVGDTRHAALTREGQGELYLPWPQDPWPALAVVVRLAPGVHYSEPQLRQALQAIDSSLPIFDVAMLGDRIRASLGLPFLLQRGFVAFAAIAGLLALSGIFAMTVWSITNRRLEFALRMALGATAAAIARSTFADAARILAVGIVCGTPAAWVLTHVVARFLPEFVPLDGITVVTTLSALGAVAMSILSLPARRIASIQPNSLLAGGR